MAYKNNKLLIVKFPLIKINGECYLCHGINDNNTVLLSERRLLCLPWYYGWRLLPLLRTASFYTF